MGKQLKLGMAIIPDKKKRETTPTIKLEKRKLTIREKRSKLPKPLRIITSPNLTAGLAGLLTTVTTLNPLAGLKVAGGTALAGGILETSPKAGKFVAGKLKDPSKAGREIGKIIEDPSILKPKDSESFGSKIKEFAKKAGPFGAAAAAGAAATEVVRRGLKKREAAALTKSLESVKIPSVVAPTASFAQPKVAPLPDFQPATAPQKEEIKEKAVSPTIPDIKITNKPQIDIRISTTGIKKRFINQQLLIRR